MDNDTIYILRTLYENRCVDAYELHVKKLIPPTTLYRVLENERIEGNVIRKGLLYYLTPKGESCLAIELRQDLINPSLAFKLVPRHFWGKKVNPDDVGILNSL